MALESQLSLPWGHKSTHYDWLQAIPASDQNGFLMEKSLHFYPFLEWTLPNLQSQTKWLSHKTSLGAPLWILRIPTLPIPAISCEATPSTELSHSVAVRWQANVPGHTPRLAQPWIMRKLCKRMLWGAGDGWQLAFSPLSKNHSVRIKSVLSIKSTSRFPCQLLSKHDRILSLRIRGKIAYHI